MASMKWHDDVKRWRVFWHVTLTDGTVNKGSKAFKKKPDAEKFRDRCEESAETFKKQTWISSKLLLDELVKEWRTYIKRHTQPTQVGYNVCMNGFIAALPKDLVLITDIKNTHINSFLNSLRTRGNKNATGLLGAEFAGDSSDKLELKYLTEVYRRSNIKVPSVAKLVEEFMEAFGY